ncbi:MAG: aminotransferase class I/II-fold pyridoxal phosphate-dependent enzyme, partial [Alphaproteobacteria bacterium]
MSDDFIMQMRPLFGEEEKRALAEYMEEDGFLTEFRRTRAFEEAIAAFTGARHCIVVNNGTVSLTLAAIACGVGHGDEVIVPNFTMIATPNSVKLIGAEPVFVDVEPGTLCMDIEAARAAITPRTRAIILVNANGREPDAGIDAFVALAEEHGLALIEDSAQALGSRYRDGTHMGLKGRVGSFSFSMPKIITTGQGGALITDDDELAARLRRLKDFGRASGGNDIHDEIGWNFKFTELQAVVGLEQMKKL